MIMMIMMIHDPVSQRSDFFCFWRFQKNKHQHHQHQLPSQELCQRICGEHCWRPKLGLSRWDSEARTTFGWHGDAMSAMSAMRHMEKKPCPVRWKIIGIQIRSNHLNWGWSLWRNFWYMFTWNISWYLICHESYENVRFELKHKQFHPRVQGQELFQDLEELMAESHLEPIQPIQHEKSSTGQNWVLMFTKLTENGKMIQGDFLAVLFLWWTFASLILLDLDSQFDLLTSRLVAADCRPFWNQWMFVTCRSAMRFHWLHHFLATAGNAAREHRCFAACFLLIAASRATLGLQLLYVKLSFRWLFDNF